MTKKKKNMYAYGGMTKGEMKMHGGGMTKPPAFNGHRCEKRNLCENMTGYKFDANGVGTKGTKPAATKRPKNFIG